MAKILLLLSLVLPFIDAQTVHWGPCPTPMVQPNFDLNKYIGKWYEIEKLPARFERGTCIEANYAIRADHTIQVLNLQNYKGKVRSAEGTAVIQDTREPAKLGVSFSYFTPYSPYWILSTDYTSVAVVYSCTDVMRVFHIDYAWILGRSRILPAETVFRAKELFFRDNIDISNMKATDQSNCDKL
ncbi:apolipoprotein D-like [Alosa sapidissima]|uniref:apolipoprotein D-like n=1 Tax=Alosa sapidissima TaxID=34773 RepID=UPI001C0A40B8|nr:apolipoprotein D-like [Alosa sapidissima]XP_041924421.1 apolipoprotein D-like [Alosa sapidissima]